MIKDSAKTILCYGDSNTWGAVPKSDDRYPRSIRWPSVLQKILGDEFEVISEGLPGRTLVVTDPAKPYRTGITHLEAMIQSTDPIDVVIIMLGTNDVKTAYKLSSEQIAKHLQQNIELIKNSKDLENTPKILVLCPPPVINTELNDLDERMLEGIEKFKTLPQLYREVAEKNNCDFINTGDYISSSKTDGYHWDAESHIKFAGVIADKIKSP